jgi:hypothetical protein
MGYRRSRLALLLSVLVTMSSACASNHRWSVAVAPLAAGTAEALASRRFDGSGPGTPRPLRAGQDVGVFLEAAPGFAHDTVALVEFSYLAEAEWTCVAYRPKSQGAAEGLQCAGMGWMNWCGQRCIMDKVLGAARFTGANGLILPRGLLWQAPPPGEPAEVRFVSYAILCQTPRCGH